MNLKTTIAIFALAMAPMAAAQTEQVADTLLNAGKAKSIEVVSANKSTNITVEGLNGTGENFYYESKGDRRSPSLVTTNILCDNVTAVRVVNFEDRVTLDFVDANGAVQNYSFYFEDPADRSYKSFVGKNGRDFGFVLAQKGKVRWEVISSGLCFGWVSALNDKPDMHESMWRSTEINWMNILGARMCYGRHELSLGVGYGEQNIVTKGRQYYDMNMEDGRIGFTPYPEGATNVRSRIKLKYWQIPLLYGISFGHENYCNFQLGPVLCFNNSGSIKTQYKLDGREYTVTTRKIGQRPVTVDLVANFRYRLIGVYVRYSPMKKLRDRTGMDFNTISTGLSLAF